MRNWWLTTVPLLSLVALAGCPKGNDTTDTDTNVDTDTDTNVDTDTDTDTNTDTFDTGGYYGPASRCPDWDFNTDGAGTYTVVVEMPFGCVSDSATTGAYTITVTGGTGLAPAANGADITSDAAAAMIGIPMTVTHSAGTAEVTVVPGTPPTYTALAGTGHFTRVKDSDPATCDVSFALTSTAAYTGDCTDCTFGFKVDSTVTNDASTAECDKNLLYYMLTFQGGDLGNTDYYNNVTISKSWIGFAPAHTVSGFFGDYAYNNSLVPGLTYAGYSTYYSTDKSIDAYWFLPSDVDGNADAGRGTTTFDNTSGALAWDVHIDAQGCDGGLGAEGTAGATGTGHDDTLQCDGSVVDVYTFTAAANTDVKVSVDSATGEDTLITVYNSTGCTVGSSDDAFMCSGAQ